MREQRRSRVIAMTTEELDAFLAAERTCRLATVGPGGPPNSPVWLIWSGGGLWGYSPTRPPAGTGGAHHYDERHGVEIEGNAVPVGPVPRKGDESPDPPELAEPERLMAGKYQNGTMYHAGRHAWLRITPTKITSWDFRKLSPLPTRP